MKSRWMGVACLATALPWLAAAATTVGRAALEDAAGRKVGEATLQQTPDGLKLSARFTGLPPGAHAFHVHAVGRCEAPFESAGPHFNPTGRKHGRANPAGPHAGDLPNLEVAPDGSAQIEVVLPGVSLADGPRALLDADGASVIVHERPDDDVSDPAGNAGARIACGVVTPA